MSLLWEPIREAAARRGWRFAAKEAFTLLACFVVAALWVMVIAGFLAQLSVAIFGAQHR